MREERDGNHDPQTSPVARRPDEAHPADVRSDLAVELDSGPDLLELVLDERVVPARAREKREGVSAGARARGAAKHARIAVPVVVREDPEGLGFPGGP